MVTHFHVQLHNLIGHILAMVNIQKVSNYTDKFNLIVVDHQSVLHCAYMCVVPLACPADACQGDLTSVNS